MVKNFAFDIAGRSAGKSWADCFIRRHDIDPEYLDEHLVWIHNERIPI
jgi:hypothetical protein